MAWFDLAALIILAAFFLARFILKVDSRLLVLVSLLLLCIAGGGSLSGDIVLANQIALMAFYCLFGNLLILLIETGLDKNSNGPLLGKLSIISKGRRGKNEEGRDDR